LLIYISKGKEEIQRSPRGVGKGDFPEGPEAVEHLQAHHSGLDVSLDEIAGRKNRHGRDKRGGAIPEQKARLGDTARRANGRKKKGFKGVRSVQQSMA